MPFFSIRRTQTFAAIALASWVTGCGAKTGLRLRDSEPDRSDAVDVFDAPDHVDAVEIQDTYDAFDAADVRDAADVIDSSCTPERFTLLRRLAEVMFVIDRSGSMGTDLSGRMRPPRRWDVLHDALQTALPPFERSINMGAMFYPRRFDGVLTRSCDITRAIDVTPAVSNSRRILSVLESTDPWGSTPTHDAVQFTGVFLAARVSRTVSVSMVLATDGGPNCNTMLDPTSCTCTSQLADGGLTCAGMAASCLDDVRTTSLMAGLNLGGIPTYVIGIDGGERSEFTSALNRMAIAGGRPNPAPGDRRYYSVQAPTDLDNALATIQRSITLCAFLAPRPPVDPNDVAVDAAGIEVPRDRTHMNGWDWTDVAMGEVSFFGPACDRIIAGMTIPTARVGCSDR